jgi:hypothetical protein
MKKFAMLISLFAVLAVPGIASANYVVVTSTYMYGTMEGGGTQAQFVRAYGYGNSTLYFDARNSVGATFRCYITTTNPIHQAALDMLNGMTDGTFIRANAASSGGPCTGVFHRKDSRDMYH